MLVGVSLGDPVNFHAPGSIVALCPALDADHGRRAGMGKDWQSAGVKNPAGT